MRTRERPDDSDDVGTTPTQVEGMGRSNPLWDLDDEDRRHLRSLFDKMASRAASSDCRRTRLDVLGPFRDLEEVGRGGMGIVYRTRDPATGEDVAVKIQATALPPAPGARARIHREARLVAGLDHPGIVPHRTSGEDEGRFYLVSDYCPGLDMSTWLRARKVPVPPREAARIVRCLADAVAHAHEKGVLHRDLKPSNVLLAGAGPTTDSEEVKPRLIDFGLAKSVDEGLSLIQIATATGLVMGTPPYMAPEQVVGPREDVDFRTDVYGLGAILYELLTMRPPFRGENTMETFRMVVSEYPIPVRDLRPGVPRALETIILRCLEKSRDRRYQSAGEFREDLDLFLAGRRIRARPIGPVERLKRWTSRRPTTSAVLALSMAALLLGACGVAGWLHTLRVERDRLNQHNYASSLQLARRAMIERQFGRAQEILRGLVPKAGDPDRREFSWRHLWNLSRREAKVLAGNESSLTFAALDSGGGRLAGSDVGGPLWVYDVNRERVVWSRKLDGRSLGGRPCFSPDGRRLATFTIGKDATRSGPDLVEVRQSDSGELIWRREVPPDSRVAWLRFPDADRLALALTPRDADQSAGSTSVLWGCKPGLPDVADPDALGRCFANSADGRFVGATTAEGRLGVYDVLNRSWLSLSEGISAADVQLATFDDDGRRLAVFRPKSRDLSIFDLPQGALRRRIGELGTPIVDLAIQPKGEGVLIREASQRVRLIDPTRAFDFVVFEASTQNGVETKRMAFSPDGGCVLIHRSEYLAADHIEVRLTEDGRALGESPGRHMGPAGDWVVRRSGAGQLIYGLRRDVWMWDWSRTVRPETGEVLRAHGDETWTAAYSADGSLFATTSNNDYEAETIKLWEPVGRQLIRAWGDVDTTVCDLAFSPDATWFATAHLSKDRAIRIRKVYENAGKAVELPGGESGRAVDVGPRGDMVYAAGDRGTIMAWDIKASAVAWVVRPADLRPGEVGSDERLHDLALSAEGDHLAVAGDRGEIQIRDAATGGLISTYTGPAPMFAIAYSPDGRTLAAADKEGAIHIVDASTAALIRILPSDDCDLRGLAYSPDGRTLAAGGLGRVVRLWDPETGEELLTLAGHDAQINSVVFSPDGRTLATADHLGVVRFWRGLPDATAAP